MNTICYVTAFLDLNRQHWDEESTTTNDYITYFSRLITLFYDTQEYELFVYIDKKHINKVREKITEKHSVYLIPIDEEFLYKYSILWRRLDKETAIMCSDSYKDIVKRRPKHPENFQAKHAILKNTKIDLVVNTMTMTNANILGWIDFGYFKTAESIPETLLDPVKIDKQKMNFSLIKNITPEDFDIINTIQNPRDIIESGFFFSTKPVLLEYQKLFHDVHNQFHTMNIVGDIQNIILQCYKSKPELFSLHYQGKRLESPKYFQYSDCNKQVLVELCGGIGNQLFQIATGYALARVLNYKLIAIESPGYCMGQGNKPSKYKTTLYNNISIQTICPENPHVLGEADWKYNDIIKPALVLKNKGVDKILLQGYFQSEKYFDSYTKAVKHLYTSNINPVTYLNTYKPDILKSFPELAEKHDYCFIGVRRGDYINRAHIHNPCGMIYFNEAMQLMGKTRYYIASDDLDWCKQHFIGDQYRFFDIDDDLVQLFVMMLFPNYIISNSSYQWWGSYLSIYDNPKVIAPDLWIGGSEAPFDNYASIYRDNMIVVKRPVEV